MLDNAFTRDGLAPDPIAINPRSWVEILTNVNEREVLTGVQPSHMVHHRGSHNKADEATVSVDLTAFDFPVRLVGAAVISLFYGLAEGPHDSIRSSDNERFCGIVTGFSPDYSGRVTQLKAQDFSWLCRRKNYPVRKTVTHDKDGNPTGIIDPTPRYSDSLEKNILRMLSIIPEFGDKTIQAPLTLRQTDTLRNADLSRCVTGRASNAPIQLKPDSTVWEGIEHLCGLLGYHVRVELREIVVRSAEEVFTGRSSKATFIFGGANGNAFGPKFDKKPSSNREGVRVNAFDTETRKVKTAIWPPEGELKQTQKKEPRRTRSKPKKPSTKKTTVEPPAAQRQVFELSPGVYTQEALDEKAKAIYLERSRQEADGEVSSPLWTPEVLELENGDLITVKVHADLVRQIETIGDDAAAAKMLQEQLGYEEDAANALIAAAHTPTRDDWYAKEITFEHPSDKLVTVHFINLVEI